MQERSITYSLKWLKVSVVMRVTYTVSFLISYKACAILTQKMHVRFTNVIVPGKKTRRNTDPFTGPPAYCSEVTTPQK